MPRAILVALCAAVLARPSLAQKPDAPVVDPTAANPPSLDPTADEGDGTSRMTGRAVTPFIAPLPFRNSQLGWGGVLMVGLIHRLDTTLTVKPSTAAIAGFASENGSWGVMGIEVARFAGDDWRVRGLASYMDLRYDYFGIGSSAGDSGVSVPLEQTLFMATGALLRRVVGQLYLGASVMWMTTTVSLRDTAGTGLPAVPDQGDEQLFAPGLQAEYDTRDNDYWPNRGSLSQLTAKFFATTTGESGAFQRYKLSWSQYLTLRPKTLVLAANVNACWAPGDPPFYGLCALGSGRFALRGYVQGQYRDQFSDAVQVELRGHTAGRLGAVVFGGFGQVAASASDLFSAQMLWAGGAGLRYQLTKKFPMQLRADYAWGKDGGIFYFSVGEAF
jgi:hypothetical protein